MNFCKFTFFTGYLLVFGIANTPAQIISTVAGTGASGYYGNGILATLAKFQGPSSIAFDTSNNYYICDENNDVIRKVSSTGIITTIAGIGDIQGYFGDGGPATSAELDVPKALALDSLGNIYFADYENNRVRRIDGKTGKISTVIGTSGHGFNGDSLLPNSTELFGPTSVAFDKQDNLYIADADNNRIREVNLSKGTVKTVAGNGSQGFSGDGGLAINAQLDNPYSIAIDDTGNIYLDDMLNNCIRKISKNTGIIITVAGMGGVTGFSGDGGPATGAELGIGVTGVNVDPVGNIYISDAGNSCIRRVNTAGIIETIVGNRKTGYSGDGGQAMAAELYLPYQVNFDSEGNMYIPDFGNNVIRKVTNVAGEAGIPTEQENKNYASVFPNPAKNQVSVELSAGNQANKGILSLYAVNGQLLINQSYANQAIITLNVSNYPDGIYILKITGGDGAAITKKIAIQK